MKVKGLHQVNGRWIYWEHEVPFFEHLYNSLWVMFSYWKGKLNE